MLHNIILLIFIAILSLGAFLDWYQGDVSCGLTCPSDTTTFCEPSC